MNTHEKLINLLTEHKAVYRICTHEAEGHSEQIAKIRGNDPHQAMKAIVVMAKISKKTQQYHLAVLPGDKMIDLSALAAHLGVKKVIFAPLDMAKTLTDCEIGAIPPFSFNPELSLLVDPQVKENKEIVFNAGLLTKSIFMNLDDYIRIVNPKFAPIAKTM